LLKYSSEPSSVLLQPACTVQRNQYVMYYSC
jgi:hypothetical protein